MLPVKVESDDDSYIPSGLLNSADDKLEKSSIKANEIFEFYNVNKSTSSVVEKSSRESDVFVDLSWKGGQSITSSASAPQSSSKPPSAPRVLTLQPGSHHPILPTDVPKPSSHPTRTFNSKTVQIPPLRYGMYRPVPMPIPVPTMLPFVGRQIFHPQLSNPYQSSGLMAMKLPQPSIMPQQALVNPNAAVYPYAYMTPVHQQMNPMASFFYPGMIMAPQSILHQISAFPPPLPSPARRPLESIMPPPELKPKITPETRKKLREEAAAKLKAERDARRAQLKAQKIIEKAKAAALKRKRDAMSAENGHRKFGNFSKDMFVIRLKDVDSFDRNNEVWRIDNHVLIQKFCGVPSLRAPARQFQSTNRLSGYDSRATWRLFIINPDNVEVDKYGREVTIHDFPTISGLREAKQLAEMKDKAFKEIEKSEYKEKLHKLELKQNLKLEAKLKRRFERKQRKMDQQLKLKSSHPKISKENSAAFKNADYFQKSSGDFTGNSDEFVCRDVLNGILDALEDEDYYEEDSFLSSEEDSDFSDEEEDDDEDEVNDEDAGSLISLAHSSDNEDNVLYQEHQVPEVALELTID